MSVHTPSRTTDSDGREDAPTKELAAEIMADRAMLSGINVARHYMLAGNEVGLREVEERLRRHIREVLSFGRSEATITDDSDTLRTPSNPFLDGS